jgi:hypothetical protein
LICGVYECAGFVLDGVEVYAVVESGFAVNREGATDIGGALAEVDHFSLGVVLGVGAQNGGVVYFGGEAEVDGVWPVEF